MLWNSHLSMPGTGPVQGVSRVFAEHQLWRSLVNNALSSVCSLSYSAGKTISGRHTLHIDDLVTRITARPLTL